MQLKLQRVWLKKIYMTDKNPISPHIQIYNWHISSLISISHRITGIINIIIVTFICFWVAFLLLGNSNYELVQKFFEGYFRGIEAFLNKNPINLIN